MVGSRENKREEQGLKDRQASQGFAVGVQGQGTAVTWNERGKTRVAVGFF